MITHFLNKYAKVGLVYTTLAIIAASAQAADRTTPVTVTGTPNVAVTNTPNVSVTNTPTVKIDTTANAVKTNTASNLIQLWTVASQTVINDGNLNSNVFDTTGYKEMRIMIASDSASTSLLVQVEIFAFNSSWIVGSANFAVPTHPTTEQGNFVQIPGICTFSVPVYGNSYRIKVRNVSGATVHIYSNSLVYLVN